MITTSDAIQPTAINKEKDQVNVKTCCEECTNAVICKYRSSFSDTKDNLLSLENLPDVAVIDVRCKYFVGKHKPTTKVGIRGREYSSPEYGSIKSCRFNKSENTMH